MTVRLLTHDEIPAFMRWWRSTTFIAHEEPEHYLGCLPDPDAFAAYVAMCVHDDDAVLWTDHAYVVGHVAFSPYNLGLRCAVATTWASDGRDGVKVLRAFEKWARERGAAHVETHLTIVEGDRAGQMAKLGYTPRQVHYWKKL